MNFEKAYKTLQPNLFKRQRGMNRINFIRTFYWFRGEEWLLECIWSIEYERQA